MDNKDAYNIWANQYDSNANKTRDLEARALKETLPDHIFDHCLEIGCGTGKNTEYLLSKSKELIAVDFSHEMLSKAKEKITSSKAHFIHTDILGNWDFTSRKFDLITFSLVLEHIENLDDIFRKTSEKASPNGYVYIGELHPFKQYNGSRARFETGAGTQELTCYIHHLSDFTKAAKIYDFQIVGICEFFDDKDRNSIPRILSILYRKN